MSANSDHFDLILRSISGKHVLLSAPVSVEAVLKAATESPFFFAAESVKVVLDGRLVHLHEYLASLPPTEVASSDNDSTAGHFLSPAAVQSARRGERRSRSLRSYKDVNNNTVVPLSTAANGGDLSLLIYGVPKRVSAMLSAKDSAEPHAAGHAAATLPLPAPNAAAAPAAAEAAEPDAKTPRQHASATSSSSTAGTAAVAMSPPPPPAPLPYPHSPVGLLELSKLCTEYEGRNLYSLASLFQTAPNGFYEHPTMRFMSYQVRTNPAVLRPMMQQVQTSSPEFFQWIEEHPQTFLSALNGTESATVQMLHDHLRLLTLEALAGHPPSGAVPTRRKMMLELNGNNGTRDVIELEVLLGGDQPSSSSDSNRDADDDDGNEEDDEDDMSGGTESADALDGYEVFEEDAQYRTAEDEIRETFATLLEAELLNRILDLEEANGDEDNHNDGDGEQTTRQTSEGVVTAGGADGDEESKRDAAGPTAAPHDAEVDEIAPGSELAAADRGIGQMPIPIAASPLGAADTSRRDCSTEQNSNTVSTVVAPSDPTTASSRNPLAPPTEEAGDAAETKEKLPAPSVLGGFIHEMEIAIGAWRANAEPSIAQEVHELIHVTREQLFAELIDCLTSDGDAGAFFALLLSGSTFFAHAEEFYVQLDEQGVRGNAFSEATTLSVPACAYSAALGRLLLCEVSHLYSCRGAPSLSSAASLLAHPTMRWLNANGPNAMLAELLRGCRAQRGVMVWYASHYFVTSVGKTIQTIAYILGGSEESQRLISLRRLRFSSKVHRQDEMRCCLERIITAEEESGRVSDGLRREWTTLTQLLYKQMVRPIVKDLPTPHMTSFPLYICDSRHLPLPVELKQKALGIDVNGAAPATEQLSCSRWWPAYCDEQRNSLCLDKWCTVTLERPWNLLWAANTAEAEEKAENVVLLLEDVDTPQPFSFKLRETFASLLPLQEYGATVALHQKSVQRCTALLYEQRGVEWGLHNTASPSPLPLAPPQPLTTQSCSDLSPYVVGELHVVDLSVSSAAPPVVHVASLRRHSVHLATIFRNFSSAVPTTSDAAATTFLSSLLSKIRQHPIIPIAAAVRYAALKTMRDNDAPWRAVEYSVADFGGVVPSLETAAAAALAAAAAASRRPSLASRTSQEESRKAVDDVFLPMPTVPRERRLSATRPVSALRSRSSPRSSTGDSAAAAMEEAARRRYARTHALDELYEMMLGSLMEQQPSGEAAVLDHLIQFVEVSQKPMRDAVEERQSAASPTHGSGDGGALSLPPLAVQRPHPPSGERKGSGRPPFQRFM